MGCLLLGELSVVVVRWVEIGGVARQGPQKAIVRLDEVCFELVAAVAQNIAVLLDAAGMHGFSGKQA